MRTIFKTLIATGFAAALAINPVAAQEEAAQEAEATAAAPPMFSSAELQPLVSRQYGCTVENSSQLSLSDTTAIYEIACQGGFGGVASIALPVTASSDVAYLPCITVGNYSCTLTTDDGNIGPIRTLATQADSSCTLSNQRYVGRNETSGRVYYEVACESGAGFMVAASLRDEFQQQIDCTVAGGIGGGCTLINMEDALAAQNDRYTQMASASDFACQVSRFAPFPERSDGTQAAELECDNRAESAVAIVRGADNKVVHCGRALAEGYVCGFTEAEVWYAMLTSDLQAARRTECVVSNARTVGRSPTKAYVEIACADGFGGYVLGYSLDGGDTTADACSLTTGSLACRLEENT